MPSLETDKNDGPTINGGPQEIIRDKKYTTALKSLRKV